MTRGRPLLRADNEKKTKFGKILRPRNGTYIQDWAMLVSGEWVLLVDKEEAVRSGRVDAVTEDGLILWLHLRDGAGRRLFTRIDAVHTWRVSTEEG